MLRIFAAKWHIRILHSNGNPMQYSGETEFISINLNLSNYLLASGYHIVPCCYVLCNLGEIDLNVLYFHLFVYVLVWS